MRTITATIVLGLVSTGSVAGCSGTDDATPDTGTGGAVALGGSASVGGRVSTGGAAPAGGRSGVGGAASTSAVAQVCASDCAILSQTNLDCIPSSCAASCESAYTNAAIVGASCQAAYLALLQCGAKQPATSWSCYQLLIALPTTGCDAEVAALSTQNFTCLIALAASH